MVVLTSLVLGKTPHDLIAIQEAPLRPTRLRSFLARFSAPLSSAMPVSASTSDHLKSVRRARVEDTSLCAADIMRQVRRMGLSSRDPSACVQPTHNAFQAGSSVRAFSVQEKTRSAPISSLQRNFSTVPPKHQRDKIAAGGIQMRRANEQWGCSAFRGVATRDSSHCLHSAATVAPITPSPRPRPPAWMTAIPAAPPEPAPQAEWRRATPRIPRSLRTRARR